jgi:hypothetical protein
MLIVFIDKLSRIKRLTVNMLIDEKLILENVIILHQIKISFKDILCSNLISKILIFATQSLCMYKINMLGLHLR